MSLPRPLFATSLVPGRDRDLQAQTVASWIAAGFDVVSVNAKSEADAVAAAFPGVNTVVAPATAERIAGKPVPYIHDLLKALRTTCEKQSTPLAQRTVGIINADIFLRPDVGFADFAAKEARGGLILGPRVDVADRAAFTDYRPTGNETYSVGYDYFVMSGDMLQDYADTPFCLGMPFWDYWLPLTALLQGRLLKTLRSPVALHVTHDPRWDNTGVIYLFFHALISYVMELCRQMRERDTSPAARRYDLMFDVLSHVYAGMFERGTKAPPGAAAPDDAGVQALADFYDRFQEVAVHHIKSRAAIITLPGS